MIENQISYRKRLREERARLRKESGRIAKVKSLKQVDSFKPSEFDETEDTTVNITSDISPVIDLPVEDYIINTTKDSVHVESDFASTYTSGDVQTKKLAVDEFYVVKYLIANI